MNDRPVVSNTTPLICLVGIGQLDLLHQLYERLVIPAAVLDEYRAGASARDPALERLPWIAVETVSIAPALHQNLGAGEAAAISLAIERQARVLILDELTGRTIAQQQGIPVIGTLGVLLRAKQHGLVPALVPLIEAMIAQGRYINPTLRSQVLQAAGEPDPTAES